MATPVEKRSSQSDTPPTTVEIEHNHLNRTSNHDGDRPPASLTSSSSSENVSEVDKEESKYIPLNVAPTRESQSRPGLDSRRGTEHDVFKTLSRRYSSATGMSDAELEDEQAQIERLMSRMFGKARQEHSEEEKTRHAGVVFRNLTVKGVGIGASLQHTNGDPFMALPRLLHRFFSRGPKGAVAKPPLREIITNFNGCIRPGEMLLVLGAPGAGCSTFLKVIGNQRYGYEEVSGDVTYGGTPAEEMSKNFRGEVLYNPEDDLHYPTLTVKQTLDFALKTKTPGKESRNEGESRKDYRAEFLRVVTKLFWIDHTLETKVGNEFIRGVSGGEKKRVSIAEAMVTKASVQAWDNSTRGLDASTALEYVQSIRSLTNMAHVSSAVALYQAGETLFELFDKVLLVDKGRCLYYGPAQHAKQYFLNLGFDCPERWTTAEFLTSVSDPHERSIRKGWEDRIPRSAEEFAAVYGKSDAFRHNMEDIQNFENELEANPRVIVSDESKNLRQKNYTIPFHKQVWACTHRQFLIIWGDKASVVGKWGGITFQVTVTSNFRLVRTFKLTFIAAGTHCWESFFSNSSD